MHLYHGTSQAKLERIVEEGVDEPSYWTNDYSLALQYASSHGDGVVLTVPLERYEFVANMAVAQCLLDGGEIEVLPDENDLLNSLEYLGGIVCHSRIRDFETVEAPLSGD